jgi:hypothetical protein
LGTNKNYAENASNFKTPAATTTIIVIGLALIPCNPEIQLYVTLEWRDAGLAC